ncbi:hypothetical protein HNQ41_003345 [Texcoconibacillus texcoconensis]|uniref:Uncharacterized protein n=1 Tax=Texcoconibacillus texcoconensis TaxID=1095777 RepID=A0A840QUQ2_9BACI|nr:hypothetical protein [Texcoconibacillus texcoconensis]
MLVQCIVWSGVLVQEIIKIDNGKASAIGTVTLTNLFLLGCFLKK